MSQVLSGEHSVDAPSRYTLFERNVFGASSPKRSLTLSRKIDKTKKLKRFSEVAFVGESPNLKDVSSGVLSKSNKSVLVASTQKSCQPPTTNDVSPVLFESNSGSSTPDLQVPNNNDPLAKPKTNRLRLPDPSSPKATQDLTVDLLTTESFLESSAVVNGQPNVLRIDSTPDAVLPISVGRLSRSQQVEQSLRKTREWLNSLPDDGDPVEYVEARDNSLISSISQRNELPDSNLHDSVLVVAPGTHIREVRILLQRLDPQLLLRVPIQEIQNMMKSSSNLTMPRVQKTMNSLLTSNKIGLTTVDNRIRQCIESSTPSKRVEEVDAQKRSPTKKKKSKATKRKLYTGLSQPSEDASDVSVDIGISAEQFSVQCPYTPPAVKRKGRPLKKPGIPVQKKSKPPITRPQRKSPKHIEPPIQKPSYPLVVIRRTRSSDLPNAQPIPKSIQSKANTDKNCKNTNVRKKSHEMTLRRKSNPRRTSLFFQPKTQAPKPKRAFKRRSESVKNGPKVVCTFLHRGEVDTVQTVIKKLGGVMESKVSPLTTHVVCGGPKRTINLLRGIARGCWLVTLDWVLRSMEKKQWVDEESFEVTNFSAAVQKCRIARQTLGIYPTIFEKVGTVYVAAKTAPPKSELCELLKLCGAKIAKTTRRANLSVGVSVPGLTSVTEIWVLDSIQENHLQPFRPYLLKEK